MEGRGGNNMKVRRRFSTNAVTHQRTRSKASVKKIRTIPTSMQRGKLPNGKISK